jgi:hypothetical protein
MNVDATYIAPRYVDFVVIFINFGYAMTLYIANKRIAVITDGRNSNAGVRAADDFIRFNRGRITVCSDAESDFRVACRYPVVITVFFVAARVNFSYIDFGVVA